MNIYIFITLLQLLEVCKAYDFVCPDAAQWQMRAKKECPAAVNSYICLLNVRDKKYKEKCNGPEIIESGSKLVLQPDFNNAICESQRYQPFSFNTSGNSECVYLKSHCTEEGQVVFDAGTTSTDTKCRCDYRFNYAFIFEPKKLCYCVPAVEDCSCYRKICDYPLKLSQDYHCVEEDDSTYRPSCAPIHINSLPTDKTEEVKVAEYDKSDYNLSKGGLFFIHKLILLIQKSKQLKNLMASYNIENEEMKKKLKEYARKTQDEHNQFSPSVWPPTESENQQMMEDKVRYIKDLEDSLITEEYSNKGVYPMQGRPRGMAFMINNERFNSINLRDRHGSSIDLLNLDKLFTELHFEVKTKENATTEEMRRFLQDEKEKVYWRDMECVVVIIMSHGDKRGIVGVDGGVTSLTKLTSVFQPENCPGLEGKPKIFFVQACRGTDAYIEGAHRINEAHLTDAQRITVEDVPVAQTINGVDVPVAQTINGVDVPVAQRITEEDVPVALRIVPVGEFDSTLTDSMPVSDVRLIETIHPAADFLIAYATPEGTVALRNLNTGSWFLNAVVWVFKYHAMSKELHHLLLMVNHLVSEGRTFRGHLQVSNFSSNLTKRFFFFPGIYGDPPNLTEVAS